MAKKFFPLKWQKNSFPPKMAMTKISASFPHRMDAPVASNPYEMCNGH